MIVVTGSHGFIGRRVAAELEQRGLICWGFDHPDDVRNLYTVKDVLRDAKGVIHLAGALGTTEIFGAERDAVQVNILGAVNVLDAARAVGIPVVQIGTGHKGQPNPYAITKAAAEDLALARAQFMDQPVNVVRAFHVYGPGQKATPPFGKGTVRKIMPSFICQALTGREVEVYGSGRQLIDLVHVDDVARALVDALEPPYGQLIEAGTGKPTSVLDAALDVLHFTESRSQIRHLPMRVGEPEDATVVAGSPVCENPWPYRLGETIDYYRRIVEG